MAGNISDLPAVESFCAVEKSNLDRKLEDFDIYWQLG